MRPEAKEAWRWIDKAEQDRSGALRLFTPGAIELSVIAFLCQQAVEKLLKAFLVSRSNFPEKTHDLLHLSEQCAAIDPTLAPIIQPADSLSVYAVSHRYPGPAEPTPQQVTAAIAVVVMVREEILRRMPARE